MKVNKNVVLAGFQVLFANYAIKLNTDFPNRLLFLDKRINTDILESLQNTSNMDGIAY